MADVKAFQCPNCGANLEYEKGEDHVLDCQFCDSAVIVPALKDFDDEQDTPMEKMQELAEMVEKKQKVDAINLYQDIFGVGPGKAAEAVDKMFRGEGVQIVSGDSLVGKQDLDKLAEVGIMIAQGRKIDAIKLYRQMYGVGLKEAKDAVEKMMRGKPIQVTSSSYTTYQTEFSEVEDQEGKTPDLNKLAEMGEMIAKGKKIEAIKLYREAYGVSLKEAKEAVEKIMEGGTVSVGDLRRADRTAGHRARSGCAGSFVFTFGLVLLAFYLVSQFVPNDPFSRMFDLVNPFSFATKEMSFGGEGIGPGYFSDLREIAVDKAGHVYLVDYGLGQVQVFDAAGEYLTFWTTEEDVYITSLAADKNGTAYVLYQGKVFLYEGTTGEPLGQLHYVDDWSFEDVAVTPDGGVVALWGSWDNDLVRFDSEGQMMWVVKSAMSVHSDEDEGSGRMTVDGLGNIYVVGADNQAVFKFSSDGKLITRFGSEGDGDGEFTSVSSVAVDRQGRVYVGDFWGIKVFDPEGRYVDTITLAAYPYDLAFNDNNQLLVVMQNQVHVYTINK